MIRSCQLHTHTHTHTHMCTQAATWRHTHTLTHLEVINPVCYILVAGRAFITQRHGPIDRTHEGVAAVRELSGVVHHQLEIIHLKQYTNTIIERRETKKRLHIINQYKSINKWINIQINK